MEEAKVTKTIGDAKLMLGDCRDRLKEIPDENAHLIVTDLPYFIDGMGDDWNKKKLQHRTDTSTGIITLPNSMKFDRNQGIRFQLFMEEISGYLFRVLKPGGFLLAFAQGRLYHRMVVAVEDVGFEIRDMLGWIYNSGRPKAFKMDHFVNRMDTSDKEKNQIKNKLGGRKTPQLKPCIEPIVLAQKPKEGTFINNWLKYETGLMDSTQTLDGKFPGNIIEVSKPDKKEKGDNNDHMTVKPIKLIEHLIKLFSKENQVVLDPFLGSGTHGISALKNKRKFIGIEQDEEYFKIAYDRISKN